jgi:hypothetical protein
MKSRRQFYLGVLGALLFLLLVFWWGGGLRGGSAPARLAVALVAVENNPGHPRARGPTVLNGITGLCAIFAITNIGKEDSIWFDTSAVEQRIGADWRRIDVPRFAARMEQRANGANPWLGISSDEVSYPFSPGFHYYFVVEWPRDVATNAAWRLELRSGPAPSQKAKEWDKKLGLRFFSRRRNGQITYTSEVRQ